MRKSFSIPLDVENFEIDTKYGRIKVTPVSAILETHSKGEVQEWLYGHYCMHLIEKRPLASLGICMGKNIRGIYDLWGKRILFVCVDTE